MALLVFLFGACIGSFLNVLILRLPKEQAPTGRSHCVHCRHVLSALDLVPILSFVWLRGRCRYCRKKISPRYIAIELATALLFLFAFLRFPLANAADAAILIRAAFILAVLIVVFMIDYEHFLILDKVVIPASIILFALNIAVDLARHPAASGSFTLNGLLAAAGLLLFFGGIYYISGGTWIGFGDVKFSIFLGLATPYPFVFVNIFVAFLLGAYVGLLLLLFGGKNMKSQVPFGTILAASAAITLFYGPQLLNFYLRTIGLWYLAKY